MNKEDLENLYETYELSIKNLTNKNKELQEENKRLKENNQSMQVEMARTWNRLDKAIEYVEEHELNDNKISEMLCGSEIVGLLDILKGEDNESN